MVIYQVPSVVLTAGDTTVNKKDLVLALTEFTIYCLLLTKTAVNKEVNN